MEPKTIPEDLMLELQESLEKANRLFARIRDMNEENIESEHHEWQSDYGRSIAC